MKRLWRGPGGLTFRRCLRFAALPTAAATALAMVLAKRLQPVLDDDAPAAATPWLALPMIVAAMACAVATVTFWPSFARGRPGAAWVERLCRGPLRGAGGALTGALAAALVLTLPLTTVFARWLGAPANAHPLVAVRAVDDVLLDAAHPRVRFAVASSQPVGELVLRPRIGLPDGAWHATTVEVLADGERLPQLATGFVDDRQLARVPFPPRAVRELTLVYTGGTVPLLFFPGSVSLVGASTRSGVLNGAWLALVALLPPFVAMAMASWLGAVASLPTSLTLVVVATFLLTAGGAGAFDPALVALFRGQWLVNGDVFRRCAPSLAVGCLAMIAAMHLRPRTRA